MEYMLLADGTVRPYECIRFVSEIRTEMADVGGVAYYWQKSGDWLFIQADNNDREGTITTELPDVIKLAAMLE